MNFIEAAIFILLIAIFAVPLATRLRLPLEVFLFFGSCIISLIPGLPVINVSPMIVFDLFLPPILFSAAYFTSWRDFKFNIRPIVQLSLGLVIFTMVTVACAAKYLLPDFSWAEAFLLGAIVSPTDASAATSLVKKFGVPRRFIVLLEGESLVNDATALILYRFSLAAIFYGTFSFTHAISQFFIMAIGGAVTGFFLARAAIHIVQRLKDIKAETAFTFIIAFSSYLLAEHLGFSGVISTVVSGIYFGIKFPEVSSSHTRVHSKASWETMMFVINGFVFTLIGFELPAVLNDLGSYSYINLAIYGVLISFVVIITRMMWIYPSALLPRLVFPSIGRKDPMPSWQFLFGLGWVGMRGIVSLAAVLAIPHFLKSGAPFPNLTLLTFITYTVIVATLIIPAVTFPILAKFLNVNGEDTRLHEEALARVQALEEVLKAIEEVKIKENIPDHVYIEFRNTVERKLTIIRTQLGDNPYSLLSDDYFSYKKLALAALAAERNALIALRRKGLVHDAIFHNLLNELDIEDVRVRSLRI